MADEIILTPHWRHDPTPITVIRNPGQRERLHLLNDNHKMIRYVLSGKGEIFAGRGYDFMHADAHTYFKHIYESNYVYMGCLWVGRLSAWQFEDDNKQSVIPMAEDRSLFPLVDCDSVLSHDGHNHKEVYGFLVASKAFRRFTLGMRLPDASDCFAQPIHPEVVINPETLPIGEWMLMLHDDGRVYAFPWVEGQHNTLYDPAVSSGGYMGLGGKLVVTKQSSIFTVDWAASAHPDIIALDNKNLSRMIDKGLVINLRSDGFYGATPEPWKSKTKS